MNQEKINQVYLQTKKELHDGAKWEKYIALKEQHIRNEDYESAEGIRLAFADFGVEIHKANSK